MTLLKTAQQLQEAQALRLGIPVHRKFSNEDLAESFVCLEEAERDLHRALSAGKLIPFRVTVTTASNIETINILAPDACAANIRAVEMLFGEFDADKPDAFKLKVEPMKQRELKRAA